MTLFKSFTKKLTACLLILFAINAHAVRTTTYYHTDGLGSVVAASDESGNLLWRKSYAPYGEQIDGNTDNEPVSYTGKKHDDVTGLTYFGARYYDPRIGRFMATDPVHFMESNPVSFNRYAYVNNNPYKYVDPDGKLLFLAPIAIFIIKEIAAEGLSQVTGGATDFLSVRRMGMKGIKFAKNKLVDNVSKGKNNSHMDPCPLSCFVAGTQVLSETGLVVIESLKVGDQVWAHDPETGETALKPIVRTYVNDKDVVWKLSLEKEGTYYLHEVTASHPYYVIDKGWVTVGELQVGQIIKTKEGGSAQVKNLLNTGEIVTTYNFEVKDINTYYVSAAMVLVHNCGGEGWKGPADYTGIPDPKNLAITKPTSRQVREMKRINREHNDGLLRSDLDGSVLVDSKKSVSGVTPDPSEAQVDHILAVDKGGTRTNVNLQFLSRAQNRTKWNK